MSNNKNRIVWWRQLPSGSTLHLNVSGDPSVIATALVADSTGRETIPNQRLRRGYTRRLAPSDTTDVHVWFELAQAPSAKVTLTESVSNDSGQGIRDNEYSTTLTKNQPDDTAILTLDLD